MIRRFIAFPNDKQVEAIKKLDNVKVIEKFDADTPGIEVSMEKVETEEIIDDILRTMEYFI